MEPFVYPLLLFLTALCAVSLSFYVWRSRRMAGAWSLVFFMEAVAIWAVGYAFEILASDLFWQVSWAKVQYVGITAIPLLWLDFAVRYSGRFSWTFRGRVLPLAVIPLVTLTLVWTNDFHGLVWATIEPTLAGPLALSFGPMFWIYWLYSYFLLVAGAVIMARVAFRSAALYRKQSALLLCAIVAPWLANSVYVLGLFPMLALDLTPVGFLVSGAILSLGLFRFRLFDLGPVAKDAVLDGMGDGVVVVDDQNRILDMNPAASRILNLSGAKSVGTDASESVPGWENPDDDTSSGLVEREVSVGEGEERRDYEVAISALRTGRKGVRSGSVVLLRDVTNRRSAERALRESETLLRAVISNAPIVLFGLDGSGKFTFSEGKGLEVLGRKPGEVVGRSVFEVYAGFPDILDHIERAFSGEEFNAVADVGEIKFETRYSPVMNEGGDVAGVIGVSLDVTERERAESERERQTEELARSNEELEQFSYSVSHDLRAPLRSIDGFSQILLEDYGEALEENGRGYLGRVRGASQRMGELIDDLLELSRINRVEMRWETVDLSRIAEETAEELKRYEPEREVEFKISPDLTAEGNPRLLKPALENLLENAWKFTSKKTGAPAVIEFGRESGGSGGSGEGGAFFVRDDGAGFEMDYAHKLFGAFQRLHDAEEFEGTGVGLATVARIIGRHGGAVWAEGKVGEGATFFFTL